jgi:enamine deaminase RidA (YjgF/YER057c/UK114 family)
MRIRYSDSCIFDWSAPLNNYWGLLVNDIQQQTRLTFANIAALLKAAGASLASVIKVNVRG